MTVLLVLVVQDLVQESIMPTTISGWFSLIAIMITFAGSLIAYGKRGAQMAAMDQALKNEITTLAESAKRDMDGLGVRVREVELAQERISEALRDHDLAFERTTAAQTSILEKLGKAERSAEACSDDMQRYAIEIGVKVDSITRKLSSTELELSNRLVGVEKELQLTRELERERMRNSRGDSR